MNKIIGIRKRSNILLIFFFILLIFFSQIISADVISINPGGGNESVLTPGKYIEGFFFGIPEEAEEAPPEEEEEEEGGGGGAPTKCNIIVDPNIINLNIRAGGSQSQKIYVTNKGSTSVKIYPKQTRNFDYYTLSFKISNKAITNFTLKPGETKELEIWFFAFNETEVFTETIQIGCARVLSSANIRTMFLLFDSNIIVLNENFEVPRGGTLRTIVTLIPMGDPERLDVGLEFAIKDYKGNVYLTKSETLLVEEQIELNRNFDIGNLPLGDYVIALKLVYPEGVAPSSAHFKVIKQPFLIVIGKFILFLIILILLIAIAIIIILIVRKLRERKKQVQPGQASESFSNI